MSRLSPNALAQLLNDSIHLAGAVIVVVCTGILAYAGKVPSDVTGAVFTGAIGYIAGRAGPAVRQSNDRQGD